MHESVSITREVTCDAESLDLTSCIATAQLLFHQQHNIYVINVLFKNKNASINGFIFSMFSVNKQCQRKSDKISIILQK